MPRYRLLLFLLLIGTLSACSTTQEKRLKRPVEPLYGVHDPEFRQGMSTLLGGGLLSGNRITTLRNGDQIFPAMLQAIRSAKKSITFETYVFWKGDASEQMTEALAERARAGVQVNVILDAQGQKKASGLVRRLREAGAQVERYHSLRWWDLTRYNNRTHRKLLVIDGRVGFIGGVGIADIWEGNADSPKHWRDSHYRVEGPVVAELQAAFNDNWLKTRGELLHGRDYFPALEKRGSLEAQVFGSSPREGSINVILMYQLAIASAKKTVRIENAYFVPDRQLVKELTEAAQRGVDVQIVLPGKHIDQKMVRRASRTKWKELLKAGVKIYEFQPTMIHCKLLIVDGLFVSVGSANFDNRSLRLNDEANMNVLNAGFAAEQTRIFEQDRQRSGQVKYDEQKNRVVSAPFDQTAAVFSSQL